MMLNSLEKNVPLGIAMLLLGCWLIFSSASAGRLSYEADQWPQIEANITSFEILEGCKMPRDARIRIRYSYVLNEQSYSGSTYSFVKHECMDRRDIDAFASTSVAQKKVLVRANPKEPAQSTILSAKSGDDLEPWVGTIVAGLLAMVIGSLTVHKGTKARKLA